MTCYVKVIADSIAEHGGRITTIEAKYWLPIHAELMTHRAFSRNAQSNRAFPVSKLIQSVRENPAGPIEFLENKPGMQGGQALSPFKQRLARGVWKLASTAARLSAWALNALNVHKQFANRLLMPFQYITVLITSTEWDNFFALRCHPDAQPEMREVAEAIRDARAASTPVLRPVSFDKQGIHLPYVSEEERDAYGELRLMRISAARCARVSYLNHDGTTPIVEKDLELAAKLLSAEPTHASPFEHQAMALSGNAHASKNFRGWLQFRESLELMENKEVQA